MAANQSLLSLVTIASVGFTCKLFLRSGWCSITVDGLDILKSVIDDPNRRAAGQGVVTVCNHISTLDDPLAWGILPTRYYFHSHSTRWALGASEIIFTNPVFSTFFRLGQTLEIFRGAGIFQPSVDKAIEKLNMGHWVHLFSEGKITQPNSYQIDADGFAHLPRFKWGIARMIMESRILPIVIPMWISGFDQLMPEGRPFPYKYFPRSSARLGVTFGQPMEMRTELQKILHGVELPLDPTVNADRRMLDHQQQGGLDKSLQILIRRQEMTAATQKRVEALGRLVSGDSLRL